MASTVPDYTISEVRRILDQIRTEWQHRNDGEKFTIHKEVSPSDTIISFSTKFMRGHQRKRHERRKYKKSKK